MVKLAGNEYFVTQSVQELVVATVQLYIDKANKKYNKQLELPAIYYNIKSGTAGRANARLWLVRFNPILLKENLIAFLDSTVPHEVAHLVDHAVHGIMGHGDTWRWVMNDFGFSNPTRCHSYDTSSCASRSTKRYKYKCDCRVHLVTVIRHNRMRRGQRYKCNRCHSFIGTQ